LLAEIGGSSMLAYDERIEATLDALAEHLERHIDIDRLLAIAGYRKSTASAATATAAKAMADAPR